MVITSINWEYINPITMVIPIIHFEILEKISTDSDTSKNGRKGILGRDRLQVRWVVVLFFIDVGF